MRPIDPIVLSAMEEKDPDLVAKYRAKMQASDVEMKDAKSASDMAGYAGVVGNFANDFINSQRSDQVLHNRMQDLGRPPAIQKADQYKWDNSGVEQLADQKMKSARQNRAESVDGMMNEERFKGMDKANANQAMMRDPKSPMSIQARENLKYLDPNVVKMPGFDNLSAEAAERASPNILKKMEAAQRKDDQRFARSESAAARADLKATDHKWKEEQTQKAGDEKKKTMLNEVEDRRTNIDQNLTLLDNMIEDNGTYEFTGSHNQDMDRLVEAIATDMAKLQDPNSVARPSEVEAVKKNLVSSGFQNKNSTARDVIKNFRAEVENRANNAYKIRGIERPGASGDDAQAIAWAKANPNDPRSAAIMERNGLSKSSGGGSGSW